jgi:hypothetical protein
VDHGSGADDTGFVTTGIATIPPLLVRLWVVYAKLWTWPPVRGAHAMEPLSLAPLVAGSVFLLFFGSRTWPAGTHGR